MSITSELLDRAHDMLKDALARENIVDIKITKTEKTARSEGYMGDIVLCSATGKFKNGHEKNIDFVIKMGKQNEVFRKSMPVRIVYEMEIFMYEKAFPICSNFSKSKCAFDLGFVPKCFATSDTDGSEILILENLKSAGYKLHNQQNTMNMDHIKLVLETYGKWHALSFAMQDQGYKDFMDLTSSMADVWEKFRLDAKDTMSGFNTAADDVREMLRKNKEFELEKKYASLFTKSADEIIADLISDCDAKKVLVHGDCWNNNFMFKYQLNDERPVLVKILDWQMSGIRSPIFDLSYFIYSVSSGKELKNLNELLKGYYSSLAESMKALGSDPSKVFSFSDLGEHWRKYSIYGLLMVTIVLKFALCDKDEAPDFSEMQEKDQITDFMTTEIKEMDKYYKRVRDAIEHYVTYNNI